MYKCEDCGMLIHNIHTACPLCGAPTANGMPAAAQYPEYTHREQKDRKGGSICMMLTIAVSSLLLFLNVVTFGAAPSLWSLNVIVPMLYAWLLVKNITQSKLPGGAVALLQLLGLSAMFVVFDATSGFWQWSVNFMLPFIIFVTMLVVMALMLKTDRGWDQYISYMIGLVFIGFIPSLLLLTGLSSELWTALLCAASSLCILFTLHRRNSYVLRDELLNRFQT